MPVILGKVVKEYPSESKEAEVSIIIKKLKVIKNEKTGLQQHLPFFFFFFLILGFIVN